MMKENSYILHCYDNLVAMATSNKCIFSLAVYSSLSPCIMCVQYRGGAQYWGYHESHGGIFSTVGVLSTVGVFSTMGDIMSPMGVSSVLRGCSVPWGIS